MAVSLVLVLATFVLFFYFLFKKSKQDIFLDGFSGPTAFPIIGNLWCLRNPEDRLANLTLMQRKYGNRVPVKGGSFKMLSLFHPNDVGKILASKDANKSWIYDILFKHWLGSSLFMEKVKRHMRRRRILQPVFVFKNVDNAEITFNHHSKSLVRIFKADALEGKETELRWLFPLFSLDVMYQYLTNTDSGFLSGLDYTVAHAFHNETKYSYERAWSPWLWSEIIWKMSPVGRKERVSRKILRDFIEKQVRDRKKELFSVDSPLKEGISPGLHLNQREKFNPLNFLIMEEYLGRSEITEKYIYDEGTAAIFAGHDTTSSALISSLYLLASNPKEQANLHAELAEVFGEDKDRNVEFTDLPKLKFLECCIKEVLRLYPPVPLIFRDPSKSLQLDKETTIPESVDILLSPWVTHRLPEFWPEPEEFRPSRFFSENCVTIHPYAYFPFAAGPRNCAGQKLAFAVLKIALAHIFRNFTVELSSAAEPVIPVGYMVMFPKGGLNVRLRLR